MARRVRVRGSRRQVWNGTRQKTKSGLTKAHYMTNKRGKLVTKKEHAAGRRSFKNIRGWVNAVSKARKALGITGFCAVKKGTALYKKAREFYCVRATGARSTTRRSNPEPTHGSPQHLGSTVFCSAEIPSPLSRSVRTKCY